MSVTLSLRLILVTAIAGAFAAGCSGVQTSGITAPAPQQPTLGDRLVVLDPLTSTKCEHSPDFGVDPCHLVFTQPHAKQVDLIGAQGSGDTQEIDNCKRLATIVDASGPVYFVTPKKATGTCAAVFLHNGKFAILTIHDEL